MNRVLMDEIASAALEHIWLALIAITAAILIAIPAAIVLTRYARIRRGTIAVVNVVQTIPSLALFGFLLPLPLIGGVGKPAAIVALILYALLPILRSTVTGILGIDQSVRESAI